MVWGRGRRGRQGGWRGKKESEGREGGREKESLCCVALTEIKDDLIFNTFVQFHDAFEALRTHTLELTKYNTSLSCHGSYC